MTWGTFSTCPISLLSSTLKTCSTKTSQPLRAGTFVATLARAWVFREFPTLLASLLNLYVLFG